MALNKRSFPNTILGSSSEAANQQASKDRASALVNTILNTGLTSALAAGAYQSLFGLKDYYKDINELNPQISEMRAKQRKLDKKEQRMAMKQADVGGDDLKNVLGILNSPEGGSADITMPPSPMTGATSNLDMAALGGVIPPAVLAASLLPAVTSAYGAATSDKGDGYRGGARGAIRGTGAGLGGLAGALTGAGLGTAAASQVDNPLLKVLAIAGGAGAGGVGGGMLGDSVARSTIGPYDKEEPQEKQATDWNFSKMIDDGAQSVGLDLGQYYDNSPSMQALLAGDLSSMFQGGGGEAGDEASIMSSPLFVPGMLTALVGGAYAGSRGTESLFNRLHQERLRNHEERARKLYEEEVRRAQTKRAEDGTAATDEDVHREVSEMLVEVKKANVLGPAFGLSSGLLLTAMLASLAGGRALGQTHKKEQQIASKSKLKRELDAAAPPAPAYVYPVGT